MPRCSQLGASQIRIPKSRMQIRHESMLEQAAQSRALHRPAPAFTHAQKKHVEPLPHGFDPESKYYSKRAIRVEDTFIPGTMIADEAKQRLQPADKHRTRRTRVSNVIAGNQPGETAVVDRKELEERRQAQEQRLADIQAKEYADECARHKRRWGPHDYPSKPTTTIKQALDDS